ncbi:hypothetical protein ACHQM5_006613 [Ranunculus cassubicifolius]
MFGLYQFLSQGRNSHRNQKLNLCSLNICCNLIQFVVIRFVFFSRSGIMFESSLLFVFFYRFFIFVVHKVDNLGYQRAACVSSKGHRTLKSYCLMNCDVSYEK